MPIELCIEIEASEPIAGEVGVTTGHLPFVGFFTR